MGILDDLKKTFQNAVQQSVKQPAQQTQQRKLNTPSEQTKQPTAQMSALSNAINKWASNGKVVKDTSARKKLFYEPEPQKNWYSGEVPTSSEILARIYTIGQTDQKQSQQLFDMYQTFANDPSSYLYNPYKQSTNKALTELQNLGIDTSKGIDDKWIQDNSWLMNYYRTETGNTPLSPSSKSSAEQNAAYWYYKVLSAEETTQKAETEWQALQDEIKYWAGRSDRNYSDDEILAKIDWSNYKTLTGMDENAAKGVPTVLNRPVGYSTDALKGVIWAARNGSTGDTTLDSVNAVLGRGKGWVQKNSITEKLDPTSKKYSPYSVGSTIDDAALYFDVQQFDSKWLENNRDKISSSDLTEQKMYTKVYNAEKNTQKAEAELAELNKYIDAQIKAGVTDPDKLLPMIANHVENDCPTLAKMDESLKSGDLMSMTRAVNYKLEDIQNETRMRCAKETNKILSGELVQNLAKKFNTNIKAFQTDTQVQKWRDAFVKGAADTILRLGTKEEKIAFANAGSADYPAFVQDIITTLQSEIANGQEIIDDAKLGADSFVKDNYFDAYGVVTQYEQAQQQYDEAMKHIDELTKQKEEEDALDDFRANHPLPGYVMAAGGGSDAGLGTPQKLEDSGYNAWRAENKDTIDGLIAQMIKAGTSPEEAEEIIHNQYRDLMGEDVEEESEIDAELNYWKAEAENAQARMQELQAQYEEKAAIIKEAQGNYEALERLAAKWGIDVSDAGQLMTDLETAFNLGFNPFQNEWTAYNVYDQAEIDKINSLMEEQHLTREQAEAQFESERKQLFEAARKNRAEYAYVIAEIDNLLERLGVTWNQTDDPMQVLEHEQLIPEECVNNINSLKESLERDVDASTYYLLREEADFNGRASNARDTINKEYNNSFFKTPDLKLRYQIANPDYEPDSVEDINTYVDQMTQAERDTYLYLYDIDPDSAKKYYDFLTDDSFGILTTRTNQALREGYEKMTQSGWLAAVGMNAMDVLVSPLRLYGTAYSYISGLTGHEINPNSKWFAASTLDTTVTSATKESINNALGEGSAGAWLANLAYDSGKSIIESMYTGHLFGGLGSGIKNAIGSNWISALPMGAEAVSTAVQEAKSKGASNEQALAIGGITMFAETVSEAITIGNLRKAFGKAAEGGSEAFIKELLKDAFFEEAPGEMFNEALETAADYWIMGDMSNFNIEVQRLMHEEGLTKTEAENRAMFGVVSDVLYAGLSGAVGGLMGGGMESLAGKHAYNSAVRAYQKGLNERGLDVNFKQAKVMFDAMMEAKSQQTGEETPAEKQKETKAKPEIPQQAIAGEESVADATQEAPAEQKAKPEIPQQAVAGEEETTSEASAIAMLDKIADIPGGNNGMTVSEIEEALGDTITPDVRAWLEERRNDPHFTDDTPIYVDALRDHISSFIKGDNVSTSALQSVDNSRFGTVGGSNSRAVNNAAALMTALGADTAGKTAALSASLAVDGQSAAPAMTAAQHLAETFGPDGALKVVHNIMLTTADNNMNLEDVQAAVNIAALNEGGQAHSMLADMQQNGVTVEGLNNLIQEAKVEANDPAVMADVEATVRENNIAEHVKALVADGALNGLEPIKQNVTDAKNKRRAAKTALTKQVNKFNAAKQAFQDAQTKFREDPSNKDLKSAKRTASEQMKAQSAVVDEYRQRLQNAEEVVKGAEETLQNAETQAMNNLRQQAQEQIAEEQAQAQAEAEQQAQAEADAQVQAEEQRQDRNAQQLDVDAFINEAFPNATEEEKQTIRERIAEREQEITDPEKIRKRERFVKNLGKKFGVNINITDTSEGGTKSRYRGSYDEKTNTITIDKAASQSDAIYAVALHELTHLAERSGLYDQLASALTRIAYRNADGTFNEAQLATDIRARQQLYNARLADMNGQQLTSEQASKEVVADLTQRILFGDEAAINALAAEDESVARRMLNGIKNFLNKMRGIDDPAITQLQQTRRLFEKALKEAQKNLGNTGNGQVQYSLEQREGTPVAKDSDGDTLVSEFDGETFAKQYSFASWSEQERATVKENLIAKGFSEEEVDKWIKNVDGVAAEIAKDPDRLDYEADPTQTFMKPNAEYKVTIDASTLCAKRLLYQGTFNAIQRLIPNSPIKPGDLIQLVNMMKDAGYVTPCSICYVESRRRNLGTYAKQFLDSYEGENKPTLAQLTTTDGLSELRESNPEAYEAFIKAMNKKGTSNPKVVQLRTDYRGDLRNLTKATIEYINRIGGLRFQSFSDFETPHLIDLMQAVMDGASMGLTAQAYTKVPAFAWVFGGTGIKINLSLIGEGTGLDANGNLIFSDVEGIDHNEAFEIRKNYSDNVGTILVGMNDAHILAAMADDRIDFIIPFHRSGWSKADRAKMKALGEYFDYTQFQNERRFIRNADGTFAKTKNGKYKTERVAEGNLYPADYWDSTKSGKENAEIYLQKCAENGLLPKFSRFLVDNGNGSFSLQPDGSTDGYWKLLIDYKMYNNEGQFAPQEAMQPNFNMDKAMETLTDYKGSANKLPVASDIVDQFVDWYKSEHPSKQYSLPSQNILDEQIDQFLSGNYGAFGSTLPDTTNQITTTQYTTTNGERQRQFGSQTAQRSDALHDEVKDYLLKNSGYIGETNQEQIDRALNWIQEKASESDPYGYNAALNEVLSDDFNFASADGQARMLAVMQMAALQGDTQNELAIADAYNKQGTHLGRALQSRNIFNMMTPLGRTAMLQGEVDKINQQYIAQGRETRVALPEEIIHEASVARTPQEFDTVRRRAYRTLAEQMPPTWKEKLQSWRMLSMLANPRTHIRNILGNAVFMPAVSLKNVIATGLERTLSPEQRTKSIIKSSELKAYAKEDAENIQDILRSEKKFNTTSEVNAERDMFGTGKGILSKTFGKALQKVSDFNSWALEAEDWLFLKKHYSNALAGWMKARGISPDSITDQQLAEGREYAIVEAQKATYRDASEVANLFSKLSKNGGIVGFVVDAALPFKKTPANILKRGIEYSPVGLINTLATARKRMQQYQAWQNGELNEKPKKAMSPQQFLDNIAAGLSGSAITALGALLSALGVVTVSLGDDDDELDKLEGKQEYALNFNLFGQNVSYTIDWAAPVCMPFFVGASVYDALTEDKEFDAGAIADSLLQITEPVFNLSMLEGINNLLNINSYGSGNAITQVGEKLATNYLSSFVPTALGQISRTIDPIRRKSYVESGASLSTWRYALEQVQNKTPFSVTNIPYRNAWGEEDRSPTWLAAFENFISPGYISEVDESELEAELRKLYDATGDKSLIPTLPSKSISVGGATIKLNAEQYDQYTVERGETLKNVLEELIAMPEWQLLDVYDRAYLVKDANTYANQLAKASVAPGSKVDKWVLTAQSGDPVQVITERLEDKKRDDYVNGYKTALNNAIRDGDAETAAQSIVALTEAGVTTSKIKSAVTSEWKQVYIDAMNSGDVETARMIYSMLMDLGLGYSDKNDFNKWLN